MNKMEFQEARQEKKTVKTTRQKKKKKKDRLSSKEQKLDYSQVLWYDKSQKRVGYLHRAEGKQMPT